MYKALFVLFVVLLILITVEAIYLFIYPALTKPKTPSIPTSLAITPATPFLTEVHPTAIITYAPITNKAINRVLQVEQEMRKNGSLLSIKWAGYDRIATYKFLLTKFILKTVPFKDNGKLIQANSAYFYFKAPLDKTYHEINFPLFGPLNIFQEVNGQKVALSPSQLKAGDVIIVIATTDTNKHPIGSVNTTIQKL